MSPIITILFLSFIASFVTVHGAPAIVTNSLKQNGVTAQQLNAQFALLQKTDPCQASSTACVQGSPAQCVNGKWHTTACPGGTQCFALPRLNKAGTSVLCTTQADALGRISSTGVSGGVTGSGSPSVDMNSSTDSDSRLNSAYLNVPLHNSMSIHVATNPSSSSIVYNSASAGRIFAETTATVTGTASSSYPTEYAITTAAAVAVAPRGATLAPGFSLPPDLPPNSTSTSSLSFPTSGANGTTTSGYPPSPTHTSSLASLTNATTPSIASTITPVQHTDTTFTLSPASASAYLSALTAEHPIFTIHTITDSNKTASSPSPTTSVPGPTIAATPSSHNSRDSTNTTSSVTLAPISVPGTPSAATPSSNNSRGSTKTTSPVRLTKTGTTSAVTPASNNSRDSTMTTSPVILTPFFVHGTTSAVTPSSIPDTTSAATPSSNNSRDCTKTSSSVTLTPISVPDTTSAATPSSNNSSDSPNPASSGRLATISVPSITSLSLILPSSSSY